MKTTQEKRTTARNVDTPRSMENATKSGKVTRGVEHKIKFSVKK